MGSCLKMGGVLASEEHEYVAGIGISAVIIGRTHRNSPMPQIQNASRRSTGIPRETFSAQIDAFMERYQAVQSRKASTMTMGGKLSVATLNRERSVSAIVPETENKHIAKRPRRKSLSAQRKSLSFLAAPRKLSGILHTITD